MIKSVVLAFTALALAASSASAGGDKTYTLSKDKTVTSVTQPSVHYNPAQPPSDAKSTAIFSNIGTKYPKGLYFCCYGNTISGPDAGLGGAYAVAVQFTPSSDIKAKEIDAGIGLAAGTNGVTLGVYDDNGGVPGNKIDDGNATGLGAFGDCCTLATVKVKASLKAGTPYWVVAIATGNTWAAWAYNSTDEVDVLTAAYSSDGGESWSPGIAVPAHSFQVLGK
jgi:hypothetical protein